MAVVAVDAYATNSDSLSGCPRHIALITPSDTDELAACSLAISWAVDGAVKVLTVGGETVVIPAGSLTAQTQHSMRIRKIFNTGTTATGIISYW